MTQGKRISFHLTPENAKRLEILQKELSEEKGINITQAFVMNIALDLYFKNKRNT